jgi:hypothetical protein
MMLSEIYHCTRGLGKTNVSWVQSGTDHNFSEGCYRANRGLSPFILITPVQPRTE